jgi:hypothetical protein
MYLLVESIALGASEAIVSYQLNPSIQSLPKIRC